MAANHAKLFKEEGADPAKYLKVEDAAAKSRALLKVEGGSYGFKGKAEASAFLKESKQASLLKHAKQRAAAAKNADASLEEGQAAADDAEQLGRKAIGNSKRAAYMAIAGKRLAKRVRAHMRGEDAEATKPGKGRKEKAGESRKARTSDSRKSRVGRAKHRAATRKASERALERSAAQVAKESARRATAAATTKTAASLASAGISPIGWVAIAAAVFASLLLTIALMLPLLQGGTKDDDLNFDGLTETETIVARYLYDKGLDAIHIAAIMGNIKSESSFDPSMIEQGNGIGLGLIQWSFGNRRALESYAASLGKPASDVYVQLDFLWYQMTGDASGLQGDPGAFSGIQWQWTAHSDGCAVWLRENGLTKSPPASFNGFSQMASVEGATGYFTWAFERPADKYARVEQRCENARYYYSILTAKKGGSGGSVVERAMGELGKPYVWGACGPSSFDCSGLVSYALTGQYGNRIGTTTTFMNWPRTSNPQPGDICTNSHHCGIYIGDGKMIHAPQTGDVVKIGPVHRDMIYVKYPG